MAFMFREPCPPVSSGQYVMTSCFRNRRSRRPLKLMRSGIGTGRGRGPRPADKCRGRESPVGGSNLFKKQSLLICLFLFYFLMYSFHIFILFLISSYFIVIILFSLRHMWSVGRQKFCCWVAGTTSLVWESEGEQTGQCPLLFLTDEYPGKAELLTGWWLNLRRVKSG